MIFCFDWFNAVYWLCGLFVILTELEAELREERCSQISGQKNLNWTETRSMAESKLSRPACEPHKSRRISRERSALAIGVSRSSFEPGPQSVSEKGVFLFLPMAVFLSLREPGWVLRTRMCCKIKEYICIVLLKWTCVEYCIGWNTSCNYFHNFFWHALGHTHETFVMFVC